MPEIAEAFSDVCGILEEWCSWSASHTSVYSGYGGFGGYGLFFVSRSPCSSHHISRPVEGGVVDTV